MEPPCGGSQPMNPHGAPLWWIAPGLSEGVEKKKTIDDEHTPLGPSWSPPVVDPNR